MAALTITTRNNNAAQNATVNTLTASDTLAYTPGKSMELELRNSTASPVVVTVRGSTATNVPVAGTGGATFDVSQGKEITVPGVIGAVTRVPLDSLASYLKGNITVEDGVGVTAVVWSN